MRIGIFGGTFNPIHIGHLRLAYIAHQTLKLNKLFFVPAFLSPHKNPSKIAPDHRLAMLKLALKNESWAKTSDCEITRKGKSYTIETLQHFASIIPKAQINLLLGEDSFNNFETWHQYQNILALANIIVMPRNIATPSTKINFTDFIQSRITQDLNEIINAKNNKIYFLKSPALDLSSSQIRQAIQQDHCAKYLVPDNVLTYIKNMEFYA